LTETVTETGGEGRVPLLLVLSIVTLLTVVGAVLWVAATGPDEARPGSDGREIRLYDFGNSTKISGLARRGHDVIIVKGPATKRRLEKARGLNPAIRLVNYEQAFALNDEEADYARTRGWLAATCGGQEISPQNIPRATLLDATIPDALEWRTDLVAEETMAFGYDFNYLDTLRSYFPHDFYDGLPCNVSDAAWLDASIATIDLVQEKTGKEVIANGRGMQSGLQYFGNRQRVDKLIDTADAVQVEHFGRFRTELDRDMAFVEAISAAGKDAYVMCRRPGDACRAILGEVAGRGWVYLSVHR
jgi:hypothetical protein